MHTYRHLLLFEPNLIIQLLQLCINFNYFEFASLYFQKIQGTAMGAAFSPTIANIFLSVIFRKFLKTQSLQPLLLKRFIDDMFLVWNHGEASLVTFLTQLNNVHPKLHFKYSYSTQETVFLDLTIYIKDPVYEINKNSTPPRFKSQITFFSTYTIHLTTPSKHSKELLLESARGMPEQTQQRKVLWPVLGRLKKGC